MTAPTHQLVREAGGTFHEIVKADLPAEIANAGLACWQGVMHLSDGRTLRAPAALDEAAAYVRLIDCLKGEHPWATHIDLALGHMRALRAKVRASGRLGPWFAPAPEDASLKLVEAAVEIGFWRELGAAPPQDAAEAFYTGLIRCVADLLQLVDAITAAQELTETLKREPRAAALRGHQAWVDLLDIIEVATISAAAWARLLGVPGILQDFIPEPTASADVPSFSAIFAPVAPVSADTLDTGWQLAAAALIDDCYQDRDHPERIVRAHALLSQTIRPERRDTGSELEIGDAEALCSERFAAG